MQSLTFARKSLQLLFPAYRFGSDDPSFAERLTDLGVGGFCLYGGSVREIADLTQRLQARAQIPLLFCGDYEDGIASQVSGGAAFPSNMGLGASGLEEMAFEKARLTALEARALGVRWVFAPVLDLATQPANPIVNIRAFGADPALAGRMGAAYMRGLAVGGVLSCAKHFPGHGETKKDSHLELPVLEASRERLKRRELVPFEKTKTLADGIMVAHLKIPGLGDAAKLPATLSKAVLQGLLRQDLKYQGLIVSDALSMNAVARHFKEEQACLAALRAGSDVLLVPADPLKAAYALPELAAGPDVREHVESAFRRIWKAKEACGLTQDLGRAPGDLSVVGCAGHRAAAEKMARACLAWSRKPKRPLKGPAAYWEIGADSPQDWQGGPFIEALRASGIQAGPYSPGKKIPVIAASFLRPKAYLGKIRFSPAELRPVQAAINKAPDAVLVSFGNPFVMDQLKSCSAGLCAFGAIEASQRAAAQTLAGKIKVAGRMPVSLGAETK